MPFGMNRSNSDNGASSGVIYVSCRVAGGDGAVRLLTDPPGPGERCCVFGFLRRVAGIRRGQATLPPQPEVIKVVYRLQNGLGGGIQLLQ
ncbi:hypothetical protein ThrDRAFT_02506 [Frankia casuarinae]|jgi:hypothetical protein|uniref:Uncharacterized protein n=1 Tax=Frankia casuarinae (strain DSM 45818 / CECT 9043 / HFP020203 / CcI3) TaxID=106370 RepID=Q2J9E5_FRACC|nr:hypothetical protein Francci3_2737 [Frankia casuarinae]ETA00609.1 hypothetical protein CcI6DRAFT_03999 [Frankia sp. CcI6]KDA41319.1 hypothetical protein BMG523Draft_03862 [Frankia sp. BMG5.23]KEZ34860.1 hypothetical protein CEDDRAFT_03790 [Frankia sp. CeD]KFB03119.1 hypothetical protein ALLO2DRAFT_04158 [Frankia sp. Allo2]